MGLGRPRRYRSPPTTPDRKLIIIIVRVLFLDLHSRHLVGKLVNRRDSSRWRREVEAICEDSIGSMRRKVHLNNLSQAVILIAKGVIILTKGFDQELGSDSRLFLLLVLLVLVLGLAAASLHIHDE